jgi:hypothetical protein
MEGLTFGPHHGIHSLVTDFVVFCKKSTFGKIEHRNITYSGIFRVQLYISSNNAETIFVSYTIQYTRSVKGYYF